MLSTRSFVLLGCLFLLAAVILKGVTLANPLLVLKLKPSSLLILANTSFLLALLRKK